MKRRPAVLGAMALVALGIVLLLAMSSCTTVGYYSQAVWGGGKVLVQRKPIERLLERADLSPQRRQQLEEALAIRRFASEELGLPSNDSYRSVVARESEIVTWTVTAAPEFSVEPVTWCFLFAGCVTYRGYFSQGRAQRYGERLAARGHDVAVLGVTAYSTLGWFADPLFEPQLAWPRWRLAALVFHELAHQVFYLPGDTRLNESFATAVEEWGLDRWLVEDPASREAARRAGQVERAAVTRMLAARASLQELYSEPGTGDPDQAQITRERKAQVLGELRRDLMEVDPGYAEWPLNNAQLAAVADYELWVPGLALRLQSEGLVALVAQLEALAGLDDAQRQERLESWNRAALTLPP